MNHWSPKKVQITAAVFFLAVMVVVVRTNSPADPMQTEAGRVQHAFQAISAAVAKNEAVPLSWISPIHVDTVSYPDGSKASLWVPKTSPQGNRSRCFYVDQPAIGGASAFYDSQCNVAKSGVVLERQGHVVIGFVNAIGKAKLALITSAGHTVDAPITNGYFIFPAEVSENAKAIFDISFNDPGGAACKVLSLQAPGGSETVQCVIA